MTNGEFVWEQGRGKYKFSNNNYVGKHTKLPNDKNAIFSNPLFVDADAKSVPNCFAELKKYRGFHMKLWNMFRFGRRQFALASVFHAET